MRPKTARRLILLGAVVVVGIGGGVGVVAVRKWRNEQRYEQYRAEGFAAFERGDHSEALRPLGKYLQPIEHRDDVEAMRAFAESRLAVQEVDGTHLAGALRVYTEYLALQPEDEKAALEALSLEIALGRYIEAADRARALLPEDPSAWTPDHAPVLDALTTAMLQRKQYADLERLCAQWSAMDPQAIAPHMRMLAMYSGRNDRDGRRRYARDLLEMTPEDPIAQLVRGVELLIAGEPGDDARQLICAASGLAEEGPAAIADESRVPADPMALRIALHALSTLQLDDHVLALLQAAPEDAGDDIQILRLRRLWQRGQHEDVAQAGAELATDPDAPAAALGIVGLSLIELGRSQEALQLADTMAERDETFSDEAWAIALRAAADPPLDDQARLEARRAASAADPYEPILKLRHASALFDRARYREAREAAAGIEDAGDAGPYFLAAAGWRSPALLRAECHLREGNPAAAYDLARSLGSRDAAVAAIVMEAAVEMKKQGRPVEAIGDLQVMLQSALTLAGSDDPRAGGLADRMVIAIVSLIDSPAALEEALATLAAAEAPLSPEVYGRLAAMAESAGLEPDQRLATRATGSRSAAVRRARELAAEGKVDEGLRLIEEVYGDDEWGVRTAKASYLEEIDPPRAAALWIELADERPEDLEAQRMALRARSVALDPVFVERAAGRIESLTGDALRPERTVRIARARAALASATTESGREDALATLAAIAADDRDYVPVQLELANALLGDDMREAPERELRLALAALERAQSVAPQRFDIALRVAQLHARLGEPDADRRLEPLARSAAAPQEVRLEALTGLRDLGRVDQAISILQTSGADDIASLALLADLYRLRSQEARARQIYEALADLPEEQLSAGLIGRIAGFYSSIGEDTMAAQTIARLGALDLDPEQAAAVEATWASQYGSPAQINAAVGAWVERDPSDIERWRQWLQALARAGATEDFDRVAQRAADAVGADRIEVVSRALRDQTLSSDFLTEMAAQTEDPQDREVFMAAGAILESPDQTPSAWRSLASRFPRSRLAQRLAVQQLAAMGEVGAAIDLAQRQMRSSILSASPDLPRMAAELLAQQGRWQELLDAANLWRSRERVRPMEADLAIAQAEYELGRPGRAAAALRPYMDQAELDPAETRDARAINLYAHAQARAGAARDAVDLLLPMLEPGGARFRTMVALDTARQITDPAQAQRLIEAVADIVLARDLMAPDAFVEHVGTALALADLAQRMPDGSALFDRATGVLDSVIADERLTGEQRVQALIALGESWLTREDPQRARSAFERALEAAAPDAAAPIRFRLARAHEAEGNAEAAREQFRQAAMDPQAPPQVIVECSRWFESAGMYAEAFAAYDRLLSAGNLPPGAGAMVANNLVMAGVAMGVSDPATLRRLEDVARANAADDSLPNQLQAEAPFTLAWLLLRAGKAEEAASIFQAEIDRGAARPSAFIGLARALQEADDPAATEVAEEARRSAAGDESMASWMQEELDKLPRA